MATTMPQMTAPAVLDDGMTLLEAVLLKHETSGHQLTSPLDLPARIPCVDLGGYAEYLDWPEETQ